MAEFQDNAVFFIGVDKIEPNPYQPRQEFNQEKLEDLAGSIKMYGILQPLTVCRKEHEKEDGGIGVKYELIAGERRLRASKIAGLREVPALIRTQEDDSRVKLELAIIENLQREDLNAVDRARSFQRLVDEFGLKHIEVAKKVGKSREYVSNTLRLLALPEEMLRALGQGKISEGHTRPLLMLSDRPEEQEVLFREIMLKKMTVRDAESIARKVAFDKVRKKERMFDPVIVEMEQEASEKLGTRVQIEPKEVGGKIQIDYFNEEDLKNILNVLNTRKKEELQKEEEEEVKTEENNQEQRMQEVKKELAKTTPVVPTTLVEETEITEYEEKLPEVKEESDSKEYSLEENHFSPDTNTNENNIEPEEEKVEELEKEDEIEVENKEEGENKPNKESGYILDNFNI